jgi:uncharacterized membrane protein
MEGSLARAPDGVEGLLPAASLTLGVVGLCFLPFLFGISTALGLPGLLFAIPGLFLKNPRYRLFSFIGFGLNALLATYFLVYLAPKI